MDETLLHRGTIWRWSGDRAPAAWFFLTIDGEAGEALSGTALMRKLEGAGRGFGSLKVSARIGETTFTTSVFPAKATGAEGMPGWLLPLKAAVRKAEGIGEGDEVEVLVKF